MEASAAQDRITIGVLVGHHHVVVEQAQWAGAAASPGWFDAVGGDPIEPRAELGIASEAPDRPERPEVRLLHHLSCVVLVRHQAASQGEGVGVGASHQLAGRAVVAAARRIDEDVVGSGVGVAQAHRGFRPGGGDRRYRHQRTFGAHHVGSGLGGIHGSQPATPGPSAPSGPGSRLEDDGAAWLGWSAEHRRGQ
ncbi:MAG: hypothetical protein R2746_15540 [Acidimicrobiales bacterium]